MAELKAAYINEIYKISKKKKVIVASILSFLAVFIAAIIVYSLNNFAGIRLTGSSEFSILILSVLVYTLIPLFTIFVCVDMFGGEFAEGTIKSTLTRPVSRFYVFLAKVLAAGSFILAKLLFIMVLSIIFSIFLKSSSFNVLKVILAYIVEFAPIFVFALLVIVISNITKGTTGAFMLSVLVFLLFMGLGIVFPYYKSFLFTSAFDWYRLFLGSYINFSKIIRVFLILCGYSIMLFGIGYYLFEQKEI